MKQFETAGKLVKFEPNRFMHVDAFEGTMQKLKGMIEQFHAKNALRAGHELLPFKNASKLSDDLFRRALDELVKRGVLAIENDRARLASFSIRLSREDTEAATEVEIFLGTTKFQTPRLDEMYERFPKYNKERVDRVLGLLVDKGSVISLKDGVYFHKDTIEEAKRIIGGEIRAKGPIEVGQVRDLLNTSRKYLIPLLDHLNDVGYLARTGNKHALRKP